VLGASFARLAASKAAYSAVCLVAAVVVVVSGIAHNIVGKANFGGGITLSSKSVGDMTILVMGLESRTDYQGNELDHHLIHVLHSGTRGGQATNTLILIHIFDSGQKAVGFSIPRDSVVTFPQTYNGYSSGKIDAAYGWAYNQYVNEHYGSESRSDVFKYANQAGQTATTATVEALTGVTIDHIVVVNLMGFYYLAQAFGGIRVCIKPAPAEGGFGPSANLTDKDPLTGTDNSGFDAYADGYNAKQGGTQYLHLDAAQSLAYVRSRDTLPGTDIGRTYRQQAAIDYVIWSVKHDNVFSDVGLFNNLLGSAKKYLLTDRYFNVLDFATEMQALRGQNMHLRTLPGTPVNNVPLAGYGTPQDIIQVNVPQIQQLVKSAFAGKSVATSTVKSAGKAKSPSALAPAKVTVDVYNGSTASSAPLASQTSAALAALGYKAGKVLNATAQKQTVLTGTQVFYGPGAAANAAELAPQFGAKAVALSSLPADHIEVLIGSSVTAVPSGLTAQNPANPATQSVSAQVIGARSAQPAAAAKPAAGAAISASSSSPGSNYGESSAVTPNARYGIPCVY
jgi:anionic cell wall polymer biosynthesis LytR-Cps2A-Psr (LCP) family protein